jgi:stearoyl-CoA desaturase (delta-9 desaturase)
MTTMLAERVAEPVVAATRPPLARQAITALLVFGPLAGAVIAAIALFRDEASVADLIIAAVLYVVTGHGLSAGYHRMCTHRAFRARRAVRIALVLAGSLAFEGGVLGWSASHRRHHAYTDVEGDPHSPHRSGSSARGQLRGALHAHVGWLFRPPPEERARWIPDLLADPDLVLLDRLFPLWCAVSLALPALLGFAVTGTVRGMLGGFLWGGLVRVFILQQATFAVNSACHLWGRQPFRTRRGDEARNLALLTLFAFGDNWHNLHHALPRLARHGVDRHQWDSTARLISILERCSLVSEVRWPERALLESRRRELRTEKVS